jgi:hypothetical protein
VIDFETKFDRERLAILRKRIDQGLFRSIGHAAAAIRSTARKLIVRSREPSLEGEPVHTKWGKAKRADVMLFDVDVSRGDAVVGFLGSRMGEAMGAHEHGGDYLGTDYPARPTMGPALDANLVRFADEYEASIGE